MRIDTAIPVRLPWPTDLQVVPAGPFVRFFALLIDHIAMIVLLFGLTMITAIIGATSVVSSVTNSSGIILFFYLVALFFLYNGYFFFCEWLLSGQTPGKILCGIRVQKLDGSNADVWALLIRNLLRPGDMFPYFGGVWVFFLPTYLVAGVSSLVLHNFRRIGDLAAGTVVVYSGRRFSSLRLRSSQIVDTKPDNRIYSLCTVDPVLFEAVAQFVNRKDRLSAARQSEIANQFFADLKHIFAWTGADPTPEELIERIHHYRMNGQK
ncbi:MAG: RDD family protein [Leptonema sp. (in: Bacteria)]|nr:RDD family protein [Leptonema sp. (in: bacteria)]